MDTNFYLFYFFDKMKDGGIHKIFLYFDILIYSCIKDTIYTASQKKIKVCILIKKETFRGSFFRKNSIIEFQKNICK